MEKLIIVNQQDGVVGQEERGQAHRQYLLHRAVHVFIINSQNQILLQQRKSDKRTYPLGWQGSVGGHVLVEESYQQAAHRETKEEIGIATNLKYVGKVIIDDKMEHEMVAIFIGQSDGPFNFDKSEVEDIQFIDVDKLKTNATRVKMIPHCEKGLELLFREKLIG